MIDARATIDALGLEPHPEGGWFRETFRSPHTFTPDGYDGPRSAATLIHYLLEPGDASAPHVVASDEIWIWNAGGPLELRIGDDVLMLGGSIYQALVPAGVLQSAKPAGAEAVLVSCLVAPGFDFADFRLV